MILEIDPTNGVPIFMQIVQQVKYKIATGVLQSEDQLPSVRQLAANLRVNPNTIVRAYNELERDGLVQTRRGTGCFITDNKVAITQDERKRIVSNHLDRALTEAYHLEIPIETVKTLLDERIHAFSEGRES